MPPSKTSPNSLECCPLGDQPKLTEEEQEEARRLRSGDFEEMGKVPVEVRDIMTPIVLSVDEDTPVRDIANIMMREHLHRIFVTQDSKITGIITTYDMLKLVSDQELAGAAPRTASRKRGNSPMPSTASSQEDVRPRHQCPDPRSECPPEFEEHDVIIPMTVLEELDSLKSGRQPVA